MMQRLTLAGEVLAGATQSTAPGSLFGSAGMSLARSRYQPGRLPGAPDHEQLGVSRRPDDPQPQAPRTIPPVRAARSYVRAGYSRQRDTERRGPALLRSAMDDAHAAVQ
jgi:hypothetical protein